MHTLVIHIARAVEKIIFLHVLIPNSFVDCTYMKAHFKIKLLDLPTIPFEWKIKIATAS